MKVLEISLCLALFFLTFVYAQNCPQNEKIVVCYYASWAIYRPSSGAMNVNNIDPKLCTHLVYTFAGLDVMHNQVTSLDPENDFVKGAYAKFVQLKEKNPCAKTILAIGGWNEKSMRYSVVAKDPNSRKLFAQSILRFLAQYEFDGIDFDWEYPTQRGGIAEDKENFILLLEEIKNQIKPWNLMLTAAVAVTEDIVSQAYDIQRMAEHLDYISLMAYDYTSSLSETTGHLAPLDAIKNSVDLWLRNCPADKLVLGIPFYTRTFKLADPNKNGVGAPTVPNNMAGRYTGEPGFLSMYELYETLFRYDYKVVFDRNSETYYAYNGTFWFSYDTEETVTTKVNYALSKNLKGVMAWSIDTDDFKGLYSEEKYPLLTAINKAVGR